MPSVAVEGSMGSGHGPYPPRACTSTLSSTVYVGGVLIGGIGSEWGDHSKPGDDPNTHDAVSGKGSNTVFADGISVSRIGDPLTCGSVIAEGNGSNVFAGG